MSEIDDPLRPAKGLFWNCLIALIFWIIVIIFCSRGCGAAEIDYLPILNTDIAGTSNLSINQKLSILAYYAWTDYQESSRIFKNPQHHEINPLLGKHPHNDTLLGFGIIGVAAVGLLTQSDSRAAKILIDSVLASEIMNIQENKNAKHTHLPIMIVVAWEW
jgi:hypothetical protein